MNNRLFAIGDIHGCFDEFREMIEKIRPSKQDKLILMGDYIIIHGHTPITREQCIENVKRKSNVLNIDTGCVYKEPGYGVLTAIELPAGKLFFVHSS
jgi:fructose/tagatose bisphosphate aldolase